MTGVTAIIDIAAVVNNEAAKWSRKTPASEGALVKLATSAPFVLPKSFLEFLKLSNGGEGELGIEPGWFQLWPAEDIPDLNEGYGTSEFIPDFYGFGSNGGGELFAFHQIDDTISLYMIPFIPMDQNEAVKLTNTFNEFLLAMGFPYSPEI